jgi:hypothetical protein
MRIRVNDEKGLTNKKAGFDVQAAGEYDFPNDPAFSGWLSGQVARGAVTILEANVDAYPPEALGPTAGSAPAAEAVDLSFAPGAEGLTPGSTPGEPKPDGGDPNQFAPGAKGLTPGSTPGVGPEAVDEQKDRRDAEVTQHPETVEKARAAAVRGRGKGK